MAAYLDEWLEAHAMEIKARTLADYRACIRLYATPRIGLLPIQAVRPSTITKLYRELLTSGGRGGQPLAVATVTHLHAVLRKAFRRLGTAEEMAAAVLWLCSPGASFVVGIALPVDGGYTAR